MRANVPADARARIRVLSASHVTLPPLTFALFLSLSVCLPCVQPTLLRQHLSAEAAGHRPTPSATVAWTVARCPCRSSPSLRLPGEGSKQGGRKCRRRIISGVLCPRRGTGVSEWWSTFRPHLSAINDRRAAVRVRVCARAFVSRTLNAPFHAPISPLDSVESLD